MYRPSAFREDRLQVLHALMRAHPLAQLVTAGAGGLMANPLPFLINSGASEKGTLRGHMARANNQLPMLRGGTEVLVIFQGPEAYVSPSWYASKDEGGKVVPTWNYVTVHAWGTPRIIEDAGWLHRQLVDLTTMQEQGRPEPWAVADAPQPFIAAQMKAIIGLEIPIARIEGKWKVSQNRSDSDRRGVVEGLRNEGAKGEAMAELVADGGASIDGRSIAPIGT
jgi:transcriptional regulator